MKKRMLTNWNFMRVLYLVMGTIIIVQSIINREWLGIVLGGYLASMGLFAFGCASGNCFGGQCSIEPKQNNPIKDDMK
ncbi:MAG: hypothetical protein QM539_08705 [Alphaproteobacteria bacterium]|nr:hypothetical protein [Alphaproteobacteria bacterium]